MQSDGRKGRDTYLCGCNTIFRLSDDDEWIRLPLMNLHRPGGSCLQAADDGFDAWLHAPAFSLHMTSAVNGVHSSGLNCYRTPAGCLVTVLPPRVHVAR